MKPKLSSARENSRSKLDAYVPPLEELLARSGLPADGLLQPTVTIPSALFKLLMREILSRQPFDQATYLAANLDVAKALEAGSIASAHEHYVNNGYFEGRTAGSCVIDEAWYLRNNPDVAKAVHLGNLASGVAHFEAAGRREGRVGSAAAGAAKSRWDAAFK